jgi:hypothetical protein
MCAAGGRRLFVAGLALAGGALVSRNGGGGTVSASLTSYLRQNYSRVRHRKREHPHTASRADPSGGIAIEQARVISGALLFPAFAAQRYHQ